MKKSDIIILVAGIITIIALSFGIVKGIQYRSGEIQKENQARQEQLSNVENVTEETTFETTDNDEANKLIEKIQNAGKKIVKLEVNKLNSQNKKGLCPIPLFIFEKIQVNKHWLFACKRWQYPLIIVRFDRDTSGVVSVC